MRHNPRGLTAVFLKKASDPFLTQERHFQNPGYTKGPKTDLPSGINTPGKNSLEQEFNEKMLGFTQAQEVKTQVIGPNFW